MVVQLTICILQNTVHQKLLNISSKIAFFLLLWGFKMQMNMSFAAMESSGNSSKGAFTNPVYYYVKDESNS